MKPWTKKGLLLIVVAAVIGLGAIYVDLGNANKAPSSSQSRVPNVESGMGDAMLSFFFPTDGVDFANGQVFVQNTGAIEAKTLDGCMIADGFPAPPYIPIGYDGDNEEFPLISYLAVHGFLSGTLSPQSDPTAGMSSSEKKAYNQADVRCFNQSLVDFNPVTTPGTALAALWMNVVSQIDASKPFQTALHGFSTCLHSHGVPASSIAGFFDYSSKGIYNSNYEKSYLYFGQLYAKCLAPAESLRDRMRATARASFYDEHATAINALRETWNTLIAKMGAETGIKWTGKLSS